MATRMPSPPPSPPALDDWLSVHMDSSGDLEARSHSSTPAPHASIIAQDFDESHGHHFEGPHSPQSEHMADHVLAQPFAIDHQAAATLDAVRAAMGALDDVGCEEEEMAEAIRSLQELSQEGSLEGFADEPAASRAESDCGAGGVDGASDMLLSLRSWIEGLWGEYTSDLASELADVRAVLRVAGSALAGAATGLKESAASASESVAQAVVQAARSVARSQHAAVISALSASTVVALCGMAYFVARCRALSSRMLLREKELARLVLRMMNLQDALTTPRGPSPSLLLHHHAHQILLPIMV